MARRLSSLTLMRNMSREIITQMVGQTSAGGVWKAVMEMFP
jgi:hypothetical protein